MSHFLDRLNFFKKVTDTFSGDHGIVTNEDRGWEDAYRARWQHDKIVRSTHGVNCTGSCSWKIYVKNGLVTWETQQTDYPRTRDDLPNHEPRGCQRGASYSWYLYSANRVKYPMVRGRLLKLWREALAEKKDPVDAWASIVEDPAKAAEYKTLRGLGGFVRSTWEEVNPLIAAANVYTAKQYGPDRIYGFSPIPAMSMVSYAAGSRYLSLIGGACGSFYDWYCDLPPASPMIWGEQTDVPESADWYNSTFLMMWGSNVPQTRTPDAHFMTEVRYKGTKTVVVCPDYSEASKFADIWLHPKQGTDAAVAMAMGHVILREFHLDGKSEYFNKYVRETTDFPYLVLLDPRADGSYVNGRFLRASDLADSAGQANNPDWKTLAFDENSGNLIVPNGSIGFRWGEKDGMVGKWNLEAKESLTGAETQLRLSVNEIKDEVVSVAFPYFGSTQHPHFACTRHDEIQVRHVPAKKVKLANGSQALVATVYDLTLAQYGLDRGLGGDNVAKTYDDDVPYTPAWQEKVTGVPRAQIITVARQFAENADKTHGKSMIIIGAAMNHWYHMDMNYRGVINLLMMCGCVGQSGGGWSHYVGQEKLRPQTGWTALAFALDWHRPPRHMNSTSFFYIHSSQWRHEKVTMTEILSPLADPMQWQGAQIDYNVRSARMGWLPTAPHFDANPLNIAKAAEAAGQAPAAYLAENLKAGKVNFAFEDPDNPANFPRNLFVWRSNLLGSSGKGHEYFLKYLLGTTHGVQGKDLGEEGGEKPLEVKWRDAAHGKLDLLVTLDFRMSTTCMYSDIVLPTATWYEKNDLNTSDMHPFIHPLSGGGGPSLGIADRLGHLQGHRQDLLGSVRRSSRRGEGHRRPADPARHTDRTGDAGREGLEEGRMRPDSRQDRAEPDRGRARLSEHLQEIHLGRSAAGQTRQRWQGHQLEHRARGRSAGDAELYGAGGRRFQGSAAHRQRHRRRRDDHDAGPGDQRPCRGESLGGAGQDHRPRPYPPGPAEGARKDPLPRYRRPATQDHFLAHLVGSGRREGLVQRRLHQRPRTDSLAHRDRPPAVLSGSCLDAGLRRGDVRLPAAGGHEDGRADHRSAAKRQPGDRAELHHPAPEVGHS